MRKLLIVLVGTAVSIGLAGSASALNIAFGPHEINSSKTKAEVTFELENNSRLVMQVTVSKGKIARAMVNTSSADGDVRQVLHAGAEQTDRKLINIKRIRVNEHTGDVTFYFRQSWFHPHVHSGRSSEKFYIDYAGLQAGDMVTFSGYRHVIFGSFGSVTVPIVPEVPEPSAAVMVGLGMVGLAIAGRKR